MDIDIIRRLSSSSALMGMLPEKPGYNGSILLIDDIEAERISKDINDAIAEIESLRNQLSTNTPDGFKLVPIEPTDEMADIGFDEASNRDVQNISYLDAYAIYKAMINAAPTHKER